MKLRNWPIGTRLTLGFSFILGLLLAIAALGVVSIRQADQLHAEQQLVIQLKEQGEALKQTLLVDVTKTQAIIRSSGMPEIIDRFAPELIEGDQQMARLLKAIGSQASGEIQQSTHALLGLHKAYRQARDEVLKLMETGQVIEAAGKENETLIPAASAVTRASDELLREVTEKNQRAGASFDTAMTTAIGLILGLTSMAILGGVVLSWLIARSVSGPARTALRASEAMAQGKLHCVVSDSHDLDELGQMLSAMKRMRDSLLALTSQVRHQSEQVAQTSQLVANGAQTISRSSVEHATVLADSRDTLTRIESEISKSLSQTREVSELAVMARDVAKDGQTSMTAVVDTMRGIQAASQRVTDIIGVIDGIAFQTNILALNAAVEAARAGDLGRGFAVVATEVRSLAQRSSAAAREIKTLISESVERVNQGTSLVDHTGQTIENLQSSIEKVADLMGSLRTLSAGHAEGIGEIRNAVERLNAATQENLTLMTQNGEASTALKHQAHGLLEAVAVFELPDSTAVHA